MDELINEGRKEYTKRNESRYTGRNYEDGDVFLVSLVE